VEDLAGEIHTQVPDRLVPDGDTRLLFRLYALLALAKGSTVSAADVHNAWVVWMLEQDPTHPALQPFDTLDAETQASDTPYVTAIRTVTERRPRHPA
jgi:hypothetical protein